MLLGRVFRFDAATVASAQMSWRERTTNRAQVQPISDFSGDIIYTYIGNINSNNSSRNF
jgi:hypothetical protein